MVEPCDDLLLQLYWQPGQEKRSSIIYDEVAYVQSSLALTEEIWYYAEFVKLCDSFERRTSNPWRATTFSADLGAIGVDPSFGFY